MSDNTLGPTPRQELQGMTDDQIELAAACCVGLGMFLLIIWAFVVLLG